MRAVPGSSWTPRAASRTCSGDMRSRRAASEPVKPAGMCWTMSVPSPRRSGSAGSSWASARGPPVEAAMTTARGAPVAGTAARGAGAAWAVSLPVPASRAGGAWGAGLGRPPGGGGGGSGVAVALAVADERRGGRLGDGLAQALGEVLGEGVKGLADRGLGHQVEGALGQRVDRAGTVGGREGADDDDGHVRRAALLQGAQHAEAVEAGHGEVQGHRVRPRGAALRERLVAVAGRADHVEAGSAERAAEHGAHERRVVGDDDAGGGGHRWLSGDLGAEAEEPGWAEQHDQAVVELDDGVDRGLVGGREALELVGVDGDDLLDVVDDDAGELRRGLDDDDLLLRDVVAAAAAQARREVVDGDDLAAQADDAADPVHGGRDRARLRVADDLVDVGDRERVLLLAQAEDDELTRDGFLGHASVIGPEASQLESDRQVERMASAMMSTRQRRTVATISSALSATTSLVPLVSVSTTSG